MCGRSRLPQRKSHAELWVELCELMQAGKFLVSADAGAHIEGNAGLMPGGAALDDAPALLGCNSGPPSTRTPLALANARLLLRCAMGRRDRHVAVHLDKSVQKACRGGRKRRR